jgi:hypothetical protein
MPTPEEKPLKRLVTGTEFSAKERPVFDFTNTKSMSLHNSDGRGSVEIITYERDEDGKWRAMTWTRRGPKYERNRT